MRGALQKGNGAGVPVYTLAGEPIGRRIGPSRGSAAIAAATAPADA